MRFRLVPTDEGFYALFDEAAENVAETARRLKGMLTDFSGVEEKRDRVVECSECCGRAGRSPLAVKISLVRMRSPSSPATCGTRWPRSRVRARNRRSMGRFETQRGPV